MINQKIKKGKRNAQMTKYERRPKKEIFLSKILSKDKSTKNKSNIILFCPKKNKSKEKEA